MKILQSLRSRFEFVFYRLFPEALAIKQAREKQAQLEMERREKADLLLEYEDLIKKKQKLSKELLDQAGRLEKFAQDMRDAVDERIMYRRDNEFLGETVFDDFDPESVSNHAQAKDRAIEFEHVLLRILKIRQRLKLYGIDRGVRENERV